MTQRRWTVADLEALPEDDRRYEIIDGELYVTDYQTVWHQGVVLNAAMALRDWDEETQLGIGVFGPGIVFAEDQTVVPDVIWVSRERLATLLGTSGLLYGAPELIAEVLAPEAENEWRDRELKLNLYSRFGVREYWIINWQQRQVLVYRREGTALLLVATLLASDALESPLLPGFSRPVSSLFTDLPVV